LIYGSYTILIHLCEVDGKLPFSSASTVLVTEVLKVNNSFQLIFYSVFFGIDNNNNDDDSKYLFNTIIIFAWSTIVLVVWTLT